MEEAVDIYKEYKILPPPQEDRPEEPKKVLKLARTFDEHGEAIQKLGRNRWYVASDASLLDLADDLTAWPSIPAVGVVDHTKKVKGLIVRRDLFDLMSRPFGRDVLSRESIGTVAQTTRALINSSGIYAAADEIGKTELQGETRYFAMHTVDGEFAGIFSSQDLLIHLSELTQNDISLARAIQSRIVRETAYIEKAQFEVAASSSMARGVGGDFYYINNYGDKWALAMCDVSGKGVSASLVTCALWGALQSFDFNHGIKTLVSHLNKFFISTFELGKFASGIFLDFDPATGNLLMCDQGHGYCHIARGDKLLKMNTGEKSYPIGVSAELQPQVFQYQLQKGDVLFIATDGFIEQKNSSGEVFGLSRAKRVIDASKDKNLKHLRQSLIDEFAAFRGLSHQYDDASFIVLRFHS